ncbi:hypothetical protein KCP71_11255 [Salmonella enterica subsp. enterica]|nr:hypothetical protein KCP71_11255 [Salmonella enterica subsp. enterica]
MGFNDLTGDTVAITVHFGAGGGWCALSENGPGRGRWSPGRYANQAMFLRSRKGEWLETRALPAVIPGDYLVCTIPARTARPCHELQQPPALPEVLF